MTEPLYFTPEQIAAILQIHVRTVLRLAQQDATIPVIRLGRIIRFEREPLLRWLARKRPRLAQRSTQAGSPVAYVESGPATAS